MISIINTLNELRRYTDAQTAENKGSIPKTVQNMMTQSNAIDNMILRRRNLDKRQLKGLKHSIVMKSAATRLTKRLRKGEIKLPNLRKR